MNDPIPGVLRYCAGGRGRPAGSTNYNSLSVIAKTMKQNGIDWRTEFVEAYKLYKDALAVHQADATKPQPDSKLIDFWMEVLPYVSMKMVDKETHKRRPRHKKTIRVSSHALDTLAKAEGRKP